MFGTSQVVMSSLVWNARVRDTVSAFKDPCAIFIVITDRFVL